MSALADGLTLPADAASQVYAFLGRRGSGKTYAAGRLVEELIDDGAQVVVLDPVGTWWGLRLATDGVAAGLSIPVFGGQHGDIPLEASAGKVVAHLVAERGLSVVLDVSEFTGADQRRFVTDFATELLHAKKRNRSAVLVVMEEAQEFAPQHVRADMARMVGAVEKMVKLGRNFGIGTAMLSQRPQAVNKDVLNQSEVLLAFQLTGPQERKAIDGWVQEKGADRSVIGELPGLPVGEALVWSPQWLGVFGRYHIYPKRTYDASATPGASTVAAAPLGSIDLEEVRTAMAATIEKARADDPAALRAEVAALRRQLTAKAPVVSQAAPEVRVEVVEKRVEVPVLTDEERAIITGARDLVAEAMAKLEGIADALNRVEAKVGRAAIYEMPVAKVVNAPTRAEPRRSVPVRATPTTEAYAPVEGKPLSKAERAVLSVLAQYPQGRTKVQVALLTGYSPNGGGFNNAVSALRSRGYLVGGKDSLAITDAGRGSGIQWEELPTGRDLFEHWLGQCSKAERAILVELADVYPNPLSKVELGRRTGYEATGGGFNNALSRLRTLELIERGEPRLSDDLGEAIQ